MVETAFIGPTKLDYTASDRLTFERQKLQYFNYYLKYMPHIFSHSDVQVMFNWNTLPNCSIDPLRRIYVNFVSTKKFCSQIHCQIQYPRGKMCTKDDDPKVFKSGNSDITACHAGCYNLYDTTFSDDKEYRGPFTLWSDRMQCCQLHNNGPFVLGMDDYTRTDIHPSPRIDTIGTGFDLDEELWQEDGTKDETFRFHLNKYYCDDFELEFNGKECKKSLGEEIFGLLVSETLYKSCQYGVRYASTGIGANEQQRPQLPPIKTPNPPSYMTWLNDVNADAIFFNPDLSLADLGFTLDTTHLMFTTEFGWPGRLVEPLILTKTPDSIKYRTRDYSLLNRFRPVHLQVDDHGRRKTDAYDLLGIYKYIDEHAMLGSAVDESNVPPPISGDTPFSKKVYEFLASLVSGLLSEDTAMLIASEIVLNQVRRAADGMISLAAHLETPYVTRTIANIAKRALVHQLTPMLANATLNILRTSLRLFASALKATTVVLNIIVFLDIFLQFADFFYSQRFGDDGQVVSYSYLDLQINQRLYGYATVEMSPVHVFSIMEYLKMPQVFEAREKRGDMQNLNRLKCVSDTEYKFNEGFQIKASDVLEANSLQSTVLWSSEYLYALKQNSNRLPIDWSKDIKEMDNDHDLYAETIATVNIDSLLKYRSFVGDFHYKYDYLKMLLPCSLLVIVCCYMGWYWIACLVLFVLSSAAQYILFT